MAKYDSSNFKIEFDDSTGALQNMSSYITDADPMEKEIYVEEDTPFYTANETSSSTGVSKVNDISLKGEYDDTATVGPHVIFSAIGSTRTLRYIWGGGRATSVETIIKAYNRIPNVKKLTGFEVKLRPTGPISEV